MEITKQQLAAQLQQNNYLYFEKPVHVALGRIIITDTMGAEAPPFKFKPVVEISTYGIHLVEADVNTIVHPVPITEGWLRSLGFIKNKFGETYSIGLPGSGLSMLTFKPRVTGNLVKLVWSNGGIVLRPPTYVHTLQNLYSALAPGYHLKLKT